MMLVNGLYCNALHVVICSNIGLASSMFTLDTIIVRGSCPRVDESVISSALSDLEPLQRSQSSGRKCPTEISHAC